MTDIPTQAINSSPESVPPEAPAEADKPRSPSDPHGAGDRPAVKSESEAADGTENGSDNRGSDSAVPPGSAAERRLRLGAERLYNRWLGESEEASRIYPGFDLSRELHGERFKALLRSGIDVRTAYEVVHRDEIIPAAMRSAVRDAEEKLAKTLATAALRPDESAGRGAPSFIGGVSNLSRADRENIARRVARGERIVF